MSVNAGQFRYTQKHEKLSKVLLVCVYDTIVLQITYDMIKAKFDKFGKIKELLIFEKGEVTKFFIEYEELDAATKAKNTLDGTKLCNQICKMSIYFSNFNNVDIRHQSSESSVIQNYSQSSLSNKRHGSDLQSFTKVSNKEKSLILEDDALLKVFSGPFDDFPRSKTDDPRALQNCMKQIAHKEELMSEQQQIDNQIKESIDNILGIEESSKKTRENKNSLKMKDQTDVRSSILCFPVRYSISCPCLYNLFSNFGNISCIVLKKDRGYIKFRTRQFAAIALTYLSKTIFFGNILDLKEFPENNQKWKPAEEQFCECIYYDSMTDRFTPQRTITINPPSQVLHISSMKREICQKHELWNIFSEYGDVQKINILQPTKQKNMALIKFRSLEDSFAALANLHNQSFCGRKMQISFTKSKI